MRIIKSYGPLEKVLYDAKHCRIIVRSKLVTGWMESQGIQSTYRGNPLYGITDLEGRVIVEPMYSYIEGYSNNRAIVRKDKLYGVIDTEGDMIVEPKYHLIKKYENGRAIIYQDQLYGLIDENGFEVINPMYSWLKYLGSDRYLFEISKKFEGESKKGLLDYKGNIKKAPKYKRILNFKEGRAIVQVDIFWGVINEEGVEMTDIKYDWIEQYDRGVAKFKRGSVEGYLSLSGKEID